MELSPQASDASFEAQVHWVLQHLYGPGELRKSPLVTRLHLPAGDDAPAQLRRLVLTAIEALKPAPGVPRQSDSWRAYHILCQRYREQFPQRVVAANLDLSQRQLARLDKLAVRVLADHLWTQFDLAHSLPNQAETEHTISTPSQEEELQWLSRSAPREPIDLAAVLAGVLKIIGPLQQGLGTDVRAEASPALPHPLGETTTLRQALLNVLTAAVQAAPGGKVNVELGHDAASVWMVTQSAKAHPAAPLPEGWRDKLDLARRLAELAGGVLQVTAEPHAVQVFAARLALALDRQAEAPRVILAIDDNADTLQLLDRYLQSTRYRLVGVRDPHKATHEAETVMPDAILLDVMLPGLDGWELLGRLHEHPRLQGIPLIVCTILPQEDLAKSLGAAGFIHKPVTQLEFVALLDRLLANPRPECA